MSPSIKNYLRILLWRLFFEDTLYDPETKNITFLSLDTYISIIQASTLLYYRKLLYSINLEKPQGKLMLRYSTK